MIGRIVEISGEPRHLKVRRGSLIISDAETEIGTIDLDGILSIILTSRGASITTPFLTEMARRNIPVFICNDRFHPVSIATPLIQHSDQTRRFERQATVKKGLRNKIWQKVVIGKVKNQHTMLKLIRSEHAERLKRLSSMVKSGDPENIEAQAAQVYWPALFGKEFRRNRNLDGINAMLNYGYAILRSAMTSAILSVGLHPTFGLHHQNKNNPLCLVDDLMEPYRPLVDQIVLRLHEKDHKTLTTEVKRSLALIVTSDQSEIGDTSPLFQHMYNLSFSIWENLNGLNVKLPIPQLLRELEVEAMVAKC